MCSSFARLGQYFCLSRLLEICLLILMAATTAQEPKKAFYKCTDLTPDLCDLDVEQGSVMVRGIPVVYWKFTADKSHQSSSSLLPIIAIHGGPSFTHHYMLPLQQQACRGRPIVFYDQAGCGASLPKNSTNFKLDDYPWLLDPNYYAQDELPALLQHFGWTKDGSFHIIANSWGTMLTQLYAIAANTDHQDVLPASMVLSGPLSDSVAYIQAQWDPVDGNLGTLPPYIQSRIRALQDAQAWDSSEYQALDAVLTTYFTLRTAPAPDCWKASEEGANLDIYSAMQGPSEFGMAGVLGDFNTTSQLPSIRQPVLLTHGRYDTMRPSIVQTIQDRLPHVERVTLLRSGHVSMIDEAGLMNDYVDDFFERVENGHFRGKQPQNTTMTASIDISQESFLNTFLSRSVIFLSTTLLLALGIGYLFGNRQQSRRQQYELVA
jgi:L-proline amide hydrolase